MSDTKTATNPKAARPMSPHLSIHYPLVNMMMSIAHRVTGAALYAGSVLVAWWLLAAALGPAEYEEAASVLGGLPGKIVLFGFTWALAHHMFGGIRHLIWDAGYGFALEDVKRLSWGTLVASLALTVLLWVFAGPPVG